MKFWQVDAFTKQPFKGNPAAVFVLKEELSDELMQNIAIEMNLSETAYILLREDQNPLLRWFTSVFEIDLCGHATLASAFVQFERRPECHALVFHAAAVGALPVQRREDGYIQMHFPDRSPTQVEEVAKALTEGLSIPPKEVWQNTQAVFAVYDEEKAVMNITPQLDALKTLAPLDVVVTAPGTRFDFVSRYFWPANGGEEDPVTGSIHAGLAPFWAKRLAKSQLRAYQASARGGELLCEVDNDTVKICGKAVRYLRGHIEV